MRQNSGLLETFTPFGNQKADTFTCKHCNAIVVVKPFADPADMGGRCTCCDGLICKHCVGKGCDPMEEKLARMEAQSRLYESMRA